MVEPSPKPQKLCLGGMTQRGHRTQTPRQQRGNLLCYPNVPLASSFSSAPYSPIFLEMPFSLKSFCYQRPPRSLPLSSSFLPASAASPLHPSLVEPLRLAFGECGESSITQATGAARKGERQAKAMPGSPLRVCVLGSHLFMFHTALSYTRHHPGARGGSGSFLDSHRLLRAMHFLLSPSTLP